MRIALAHYVERKVEEGTLASYADAAARLGITRARMTQVMDLLLMQASKLEIDIGAGLRKEPTRSHQTSRAQSPSPH